MPRVSKVKTTPPTIRQRAKEPDKCEGIKHIFEDKNAEGSICRCGKTRLTTETDGKDTWKRAVPIEEDDKTLTGAPEPSVQTSTETLPTVVLTEDRIVKIHAPTPLVTFHLRRVGNELTDVAHTVHIPSPSIIQPGEHVVIHVYREE